MNRREILERLRGGLIVSCQALEGEPLHGPAFMAAMARAAEMGGAVGIRANSPEDIQAIKTVCSLPLIGLYKRTYPNSDIYITPTMREVRAVVDAGAEIVAIDATQRPRPDGLTLEELVRQIRAESEVLIVGDVSTYEEGLAAARAGVDIVSTTLSGYTPYSRQGPTADLELVARLAADLPVPVIAEGRIWTPEEARKALEAGAFAVVVGTAITRPQEIVRRFVQALSGPDRHQRARA
ncbi:MAG: N-acetylmannosamine-6-phosphate 2-epimerase [Firmicutes bacterium]|nr:N-acetylmannosamine-6-phosphate 2-epimerase [Bacillota bacterium]